MAKVAMPFFPLEADNSLTSMQQRLIARFSSRHAADFAQRLPSAPPAGLTGRRRRRQILFLLRSRPDKQRGGAEIMSFVSLMDIENPSRLVRFPNELCIRNKELPPQQPPVYHREINSTINCFCFNSASRLFTAAPQRSFGKCRAEAPLINIYLLFTRKEGISERDTRCHPRRFRGAALATRLAGLANTQISD